MSERLLYTVSAKGSMRRDEFYDAMSRDWMLSAGAAPESGHKSDRRLEILRLFEALGFCEIDWETRKIYAIPPAWFMLTTPGLPAVVLVGGRSPGLMKNVRAACKALRPQIHLSEGSRAWAGAAFPSMVIVRSSNREALSKLAEMTVPLRGDLPGSWSLLSACSGLQELVSTLKYDVLSDPVGWPKRTFDISRLLFQSPEMPGLQAGVLHAFTNPVSQARMHVVWKDGRGAQVHRDWGRYFALHAAGRNVLFYSKSARAFAVPVTAPLPALIQRSIALCAGSLPKQVVITSGPGSGQLELPYNVFPGVPSAIANLAADKVKQELQAWDLDEPLRSELCLTSIR